VRYHTISGTQRNLVISRVSWQITLKLRRGQGCVPNDFFTSFSWILELIVRLSFHCPQFFFSLVFPEILNLSCIIILLFIVFCGSFLSLPAQQRCQLLEDLNPAHDQDFYFSFWTRLRQFVSRNVRRMLFLFNTLTLSCRPIQSCVCLYWRHMFRYGRNDCYHFKGKLHKWIIQTHCERLQTDHLRCIVKI